MPTSPARPVTAGAFVLLSLLCLATPALAQQANPSPQPAAPDDLSADRINTGRPAPQPVPTLPAHPDVSRGGDVGGAAGPELAAPQPNPTGMSEAGPLAGYTNGNFFLRSQNSNFVVFLNGRLQIDTFTFLNRGNPPAGVVADSAADPRPRDTIFVRRIRPEINGTVIKFIDWYLSGEFGTTPTGSQYGTFTDVYINVGPTPWANFQIGQYDAPFSLENRTTDKYFDFMERSLAVRDLAVPNNKELGLMFWGIAPRRYVYYSAGIFNGDGQDVKNLDNNFDFLGRAFFAPLALLKQSEANRWMTEMWIGGSLWWGQRGPVPYNVPAFTTQGGVSLLPATFGNFALGSNGDVFKWAVELNAPVGPFGLRFELTDVSEGLALYDTTMAASTTAPCTTTNGVHSGCKNVASLNRNGSAFYVQAWYWILGDYNLLPPPGLELLPRWKGYRPEVGAWKFALMATAKYEHMSVTISPSDPTTMFTAPQQAILGNMTVDVAELGLNAWVTKHLRFTANYVMNYLSGDMKVLQSGGRYFQNAEHELLFRAALAL